MHAPGLEPDDGSLRAAQAGGDHKTSPPWESFPSREAYEPRRGCGDEEAQGDGRGYTCLGGKILRRKKAGTPDCGDAEQEQIDDGFGAHTRCHATTL
ncbi:hypothetical protein GCM10017690_26380 [Microbacterium terregens]